MPSQLIKARKALLLRLVHSVYIQDKRMHFAGFDTPWCRQATVRTTGITQHNLTSRSCSCVRFYIITVVIIHHESLSKSTEPLWGLVLLQLFFIITVIIIHHESFSKSTGSVLHPLWVHRTAQERVPVCHQHPTTKTRSWGQLGVSTYHHLVLVLKTIGDLPPRSDHCHLPMML